ncbi:MAG: isopenicillin-N epimerase [Planctomycetota bacterium]|jgi:isopenicillin-N epimerase
MLNRRNLLGSSLGLSAIGMPAWAAAPAPARSAAEVLARAAGSSNEEDYWEEIARAFTLDRSLINLNNGGVHPASRIVQESMKQHLDYSHRLPAYTMWRVLEKQREGVRAQLANEWAVDPEEIAITRNASEGLNILQLGMDLKRGDEVLTTNQDYPRMLTAFHQRERREGVVLREISIPTPAEDPAEVVRLFEEAITPKTKLLLCCHVINLTGQVLPVKDIAAMARRHGVDTIVDGAHALAHLDFKLSDLGVDFYASSLHKWLAAPHGTGLLYVRRNRIADVWPLQAAVEKLDGDIRKFEQIGTHPAANALAISEAIHLHQGIGQARKSARLVALRQHWIERLGASGRLRLNTSEKPGLAGAMANFSIDGIESPQLVRWLWGKRQILTIHIQHDEFEGIRVSPSIDNTKRELDRFCEAVEHIMADGFPA